jgi:hypothetical protein
MVNLHSGKRMDVGREISTEQPARRSCHTPHSAKTVITTRAHTFVSVRIAFSCAIIAIDLPVIDSILPNHVKLY